MHFKNPKSRPLEFCIAQRKKKTHTHTHTQTLSRNQINPIKRIQAHKFIEKLPMIAIQRPIIQGTYSQKQWELINARVTKIKIKKERALLNSVNSGARSLLGRDLR